MKWFLLILLALTFVSFARGGKLGATAPFVFGCMFSLAFGVTLVVKVIFW